MLEHLAGYLRSCAREIARFRAAERGTTAVEFALVAPAFLATLLALMQMALFIFAQQVLQNAATQAGRLFMTNQAQSDSQTAFKNLICTTYLPYMFNCNSLVVIVQSAASFSSTSTSAPALYNNGQPVTTWTYSPGNPGEVMVLQLVYPWSVFGGPLGLTLANLPNSAREMMGISAFRVEP